MRTLWAIIAATLALLATPAALGAAAAHPPVPTVGLIKVTPDGAVTVTIIHDALAFALNDTSVRVGDPAMFAFIDGPQAEIIAGFDDGLARLKVGLRLTVDGSPLSYEATEAPSLTALKQWLTEHPDRTLPCKMDFVVRATLPAGAKSLTCRFPEILSDVLVVIDRPGMEPSEFPLAPAEVSPPIDVRAASASPPGQAAPEPRSDVSALSVFWRYVKFGFRHIIPQGADHACFVLGLFLLSPRWKPVLLQITSFTIAHTVTLTLTSLHVVGLSGSIVEPAIALSIAFIGIENLLTKQVHPWRLAVAFVFGLVHGMGVATAFNEVGFPPGQLVPSLAAFTIGVEGGHIAVLAAAFLVLGWFRDKPWYRARIAIPLSTLIAIVALVWTVQRIWP
jgi:hypothetical protein